MPEALAEGIKKRSYPKSYAWTPFIHTLSNILNIFSNSMWKKDNNLPVKIKLLCHYHFINLEKSKLLYLQDRVHAGQLGSSARSSFAFRESRARLYRRIRERAKHTWFWRSLFIPCWQVINGIYDRLASNQKHPTIASMYEQVFHEPWSKWSQCKGNGLLTVWKPKCYPVNIKQDVVVFLIFSTMMNWGLTIVRSC